MHEQKKRMFFIKFPYWLGIAADVLWAVGLLIPQVFSSLIGRPDFNPDLQTRLIMGIGASLMTGWTFLLYWAVRKPIERRAVILITAFPVVFGLSIVALFGFLKSSTFYLWILIKCSILIISMVTSYVLSSNLAKEMNRSE